MMLDPCKNWSLVNMAIQAKETQAEPEVDGP